MDLRRLARVLFVAVVLVIYLHGEVARANILFRVQNKFAGRERSLGALKAHDAHRHARILSAVDLPLGGDSLAESAGLYFTKIGLGSPSKDYYVQVDTGSDILWVNCAECTRCPKKSDLDIKLTLYDTKSSSTAKRVTCDDDFCSLISSSQSSTCQLGSPCEYTVVYGDGSSTNGYFVRDTVHLDQVTGNHQTGSTNGSIVFGCGAKQSGQLGGSQSAVDGILGFGQKETSMISQLAAAGKVARKFAHCLDNVNGGGIFAIGEVVSPKVKTTPMVPNQYVMLS
ncbi:aspartic proteinase-like protein 2 isoform X1 [Carica papaya]|uniref:aspartic proteinase-like protein 2 isoform X1 n=1 Tax=Carica papaya TaxID=3649 RepID=UPI000B8CF643|nr:aspartic proteinase-like protein 2 isoform X1 [Carica papaya]